MGVLFSAQDDSDFSKEDTAQFENIKNEAQELKDLKTKSALSDYPRLVFEKIFCIDIKRLASMKELWKERQAPRPLQFTDAKPAPLDELQIDQSVWTFEMLIEKFLASCAALQKDYAKQVAADPLFSLTFDKDDSDMLDFVTAAANLRAMAFGISQLSRWSVKEMAGNIIPGLFWLIGSNRHYKRYHRWLDCFAS